jgi:hypothetical protein
MIEAKGALLAAIDAATSHAGLDAIDVTSGGLGEVIRQRGTTSATQMTARSAARHGRFCAT